MYRFNIFRSNAPTYASDILKALVVHNQMQYPSEVTMVANWIMLTGLDVNIDA
jgi:hypothetical protein